MCSKASVKTADTMFRIVDALQEFDGARVSELSDNLDIGKSTVYRHLSALQENRYVVKQGDIYYLSLKFLEHGYYAQHREPVYRMAKPIVEKLAVETEERCQFVVKEHYRGVYVHVASGDRGVETDTQGGQRFDLHVTACGKAILANLPERELVEVIEKHGLPRLTESSITDEEELREELATIREQGYAFNREGRVEGLCSVGVPVLGVAGQVLGALSVSAPAGRMRGEWYRETLPDILLGAADELELNVRYR
ncbi:IclR family transcriptional regulator [Halogeometricum luteum]|uniref:IclR family transcriptional regulator n=1 Tax=Halogeometricum luteum TaxID=2950537 RepID=A0ABU2G2A5_9EURY|nr:IclR family transcriptional regulator [Halogeometricum sp. S3BR5-2]MDS0294916.1 IclR family transcriptional regulator [Halogeometricum sp. S3BR5-2]